MEFVLYNLVGFLITGEEPFLVRFSSLCRSFNVDVPRVLARFSTARNARLITRALNCKAYTRELELSFTEESVSELLRLRLRLQNRTRVVRRNLRADAACCGRAELAGGRVLYDCNEAMLCLLRSRYDPRIYAYERVPGVVAEAGTGTAGAPSRTVFLCGESSVPFHVYAIARIRTGSELRVKVTEDCVPELLRAENRRALDALFTRRPGNGVLANTLCDLYRSARTALYGADAISRASCS
ncbi:VLTF [Eastern grey kangaroopox virus]|uniref:Late transcription elongation factor OPG087 n=1 Tax=Eastern grey kangaroopox virus TaxID=2042482 RepID=A0A2C9DT27_9POXV|nr:VLTF [Eastern grey kangaroopox virus]ATI21160.1 VLTF [Eastern grey kangaroopox virus]ATX75068.1 VLTF [Eastern grey kangaroopox virus]